MRPSIHDPLSLGAKRKRSYYKFERRNFITIKEMKEFSQTGVKIDQFHFSACLTASPVKFNKNFAESTAEFFGAFSEGNPTGAGPCWAGNADTLSKLPTPLIDPPRKKDLSLEKLDAGYVPYDYSMKFNKITP